MSEIPAAREALPGHPEKPAAHASFGTPSSPSSPSSPSARPWLPVLNVSISWLNNIFVALGAFVVTPALLAGLGDQDYGIWLLISAFVGYMRILELGMTSGCMKFSSGAYERGDEAALRRVFSSSMAIFAGLALLACGAVFVLAATLPGFFPDLLSGTHLVVITLGMSVVVDLFCRPFAASVRARSYFFLYDGTETLTYLVFKLGLVLYFAWHGLSLETLSLIALGESIARNGIVLALALKFCPWTAKPRPRHIDRAMLKLLGGFSGACFLISLANLVGFQIDSAVIGKFVDGAAKKIAIFGIGVQMIRMIASSVGATWAVLIPRFSGLCEKGDQAGVRQLLRRSTLVTGLFTAFALISVAVFGLPFLGLWIGKPWVDQSYTVMLIFLPGYAIAMAQGPASGLLWGAGRLKWQAAITYLEAGLNLALSLLLVGPLGIFGVCLGTSIPMTLVRGILFPLVLRHECGIGLREYFSMYIPILAVGAAYGVLIVGFGFLHYASFLELFPVCVLCTLIFGILLLLMVPNARRPALNLARGTRLRLRRLLG